MQRNELDLGRGLILPRSVNEAGSVVSVGLVTGLDITTFSVAIGAILFAGPLSGGQPLAVIAALTGSLVLVFSALFFSRIRGNLPHAQDMGAAILAPALASGVAVMQAPPSTRIATALAVVAVATLSTGALIWMTGYFRLGRIMRYFPQTVLAGFLAGTGWILAASGVSVSAGLSMDQIFSPVHWQGALLMPMIAAIAVGLALWLLLRVWDHPLVLIAVLGLASLACHVVRWLTGTSLPEAQDAGWLTRSPAEGALPDVAGLWAVVDWAVVAGYWPVILTVAFLCLIAATINLSAVAAVSGSEADMDRELQVTGLANMVAGGVAAPPSYVGLASSVITLRMAGGHRGILVVVIATLLLGLAAANMLVLAVPGFVTSGLVLFFGLDLLQTWLVATRKKYSVAEWSIVVLIVVLFALLGVGTAVVIGLMMAMAVFVWTTASLPVFRRVRTLAGVQSTLERNPAEQAIVLARADEAMIVELEGYVFFATADRIHGLIAHRLGPSGTPPLRWLVLDFAQVLGLDSSASTRLARIAALARRRGVTLVLSRLAANVQDTLNRAEPELLNSPDIPVCATLDQAVEWVEDDLLGPAGEIVPSQEMANIHAGTPADIPALARFIAELEAETLDKGGVILRHGDAADGFVLLERGRVAVMQPGIKGVATRLRGMAAGAILGDIAAATGGVRSADVVADTDVVVRRVSFSRLEALEHSDPASAMVVQRMVMRALALKVLTANRIAAAGLS